MIKRPLVWVLAAFVAGILLAWCKASLLLIILVIIAYLFILYLLFIRTYRKNRLLIKKDCFLLSLPVVMLLGLLALRECTRPFDLDNAFDEEASCIITGKVSAETDRPNGKVLHVTGCMVMLEQGGRFRAGNIILYTNSSQSFLPGNRVKAAGTILKLSKPSNPGQFNEYMYYKSKNTDYKAFIDSICITDARFSKPRYWLQKLRNGLLNTYKDLLGDKEAGTLAAIVLGDKYLFFEETKRLYHDSGISHILAISGLHVTLIGMSVYKLLKKVKAGLVPAAVISSLIMILYGVMTDLSVSTHRAVVMFIVMMLSRLIGRTYDILSALSLTAIIILLQSPMQLFQAGFLFSFGAVWGIAVIYPAVKKLLGIKHVIPDTVAVSFSVQAATLPVLLAVFYQFPLYGILINVVVTVLMSFLMLSALLAGAAGMISMRFGMFLVGGANYILKFYEAICRINTSLPKSLITTGRPAPWRIILYYILIILFILGASRYKKKRMLWIPLAAIILLVFPAHKSGLRVTLPDMGQGEAIIISTEEGSTILIDGGSLSKKKCGKYLLEPYLLYTGTDRIDYAIVTHPDEDHISGLMELLSGHRIDIKNLVLPDVFSKAGLTAEESKKMGKKNYDELKELAHKAGTRVLFIDEGDTITEGELKITCLFPAKGLHYVSANAYSTVLSLTYGEFDMLLTGDITSQGEDYILRRNLSSQKEGYDILKVAHHGSKYSSKEDFLDIVKPEIALISCGKNNRYGHPHGEVLERLDDIGSEVLITYESGAITIKTDGKRMRVEEFIGDKGTW